MFEIIPPFDAGDFEIPAGVQTLIEHPYCRQGSPPQESRSLGQQRDKSRGSSLLTHSRARSRARSLASSPAAQSNILMQMLNVQTEIRDLLEKISDSHQQFATSLNVIAEAAAQRHY
ncbi:hypothetical protein Pcinc_005437 [Petrolisthes cinctipes]|uniref:Uncharacterized protein n=1 Tax=Petrolisthes cinctipes TaxID=88211 RepID=A0AAE1FI39_PETCI|nr:hypothetical protein Pcinc_020567 [Petrolisthes cinctipes]KAK3890642.1 hypothetical protein Pcinc_005437 [Petrolisthes cinctipes]